MRALHVLGADGFGGTTLRHLRIMKRMRERGWELRALATDPRAQACFRDDGFEVVDLDVIRRPVRPVWDIRGLRRLTDYLRSERYDVVHTTASKPGFVGRIAARHAGVPVIVHSVAGFAFHEQSGPLEVGVYSRLERYAAAHCDCVTTVSQFHRDWAVRLRIAAPEKLRVVRTGIPEDRVATTMTVDEARSSLGLTPEHFVVLSAGRLAEQKGYRYLIEAAPLIQQQVGSALRIVIAGEGELEAQLKGLARKSGVDDYVLFPGFRSDVGNLLAAGDIIAIPSLWEGLAQSVLEAMAAGRPIVTTTIGSNAEALEHEESALLVPAKDSRALADAIVRLHKEPALAQRIADGARRRYLAEFTVETMLDGYEEVYVDLVQAKMGHT